MIASGERNTADHTPTLSDVDAADWPRSIRVHLITGEIKRVALVAPDFELCMYSLTLLAYILLQSALSALPLSFWLPPSFAAISLT